MSKFYAIISKQLIHLVKSCELSTLFNTINGQSFNLNSLNLPDWNRLYFKDHIVENICIYCITKQSRIIVIQPSKKEPLKSYLY
jgi:hypothetical protein